LTCIERASPYQDLLNPARHLVVAWIEAS